MLVLNIFLYSTALIVIKEEGASKCYIKTKHNRVNDYIVLYI